MDIQNAPIEKELNVAFASAKRISELTARIALLETQPARSRVLLADSLLTVAQTSFDFQNLSQNFQSLEIVASIRTDRVSVTDGVALRFNNDSGANYDWVWIDGRNETSTSIPVFGSNDAVADAQIEIGFFTGNSAPIDTFGSFRLLIPFYSSVVSNKHTELTGGRKNTAARENIFINSSFGVWRNIAAINRVTLLPVFGTNFVIDSRVSVYGLV